MKVIDSYERMEVNSAAILPTVHDPIADYHESELDTASEDEPGYKIAQDAQTNSQTQNQTVENKEGEDVIISES